MNRQNGYTLVELAVALALAAFLIGVAALLSSQAVNREGSRGAIYEIQTMAQVARAEAVARNRDSRLLLCPATQQLLVTDSQGTADVSDDVVLHSTTLTSTIAFSRPDAGDAVTWDALGGSPAWFGVRYASDGTIEAGEGDVILLGGERYGRISLHVSGGTEVSTWSNGEWHASY